MAILQERRKNDRELIKRLTDMQFLLEEAMNGKGTIPPHITQFLAMIAKTDDVDNQYKALTNVIEERQAEYRELLRSNATKSLSCFYEFLRPDEPPALHHEFICDRLEAIANRDIMRSIISAPPGSAKSTYGAHFFPAWYMGNHPNHKFIQAGHSQDFVENEFGRRVRGIIDSEEYREVFPEIKLSTSSKAAGAFQLSGKLGRYLTRGIGQGISGYRSNIAGVDDPYASRSDAESAATRKKVYDWLMADFTTRLLPRSPMFIIATRWHPLDICGVLEDMTKKGIGLPWDIVNLSAIAEDDDPLGRAPGECLWPEFYELDHYLNLKSTLPSRDWNSLYMGKPVDEQGGVVKTSWFQRYTALPSNIRSESGNIISQRVKRITLSADTANKDGQRNDYTVITIWVEDIDGHHYLAFVHRERLQFDAMVAKVNDLAALWNVDAILMEDKGSGTQYIQTQSDKAPAPVIPISVNNETKAFRFDGTTPMFEAGLVHLPEQANWLADYERELLQFPGGAYDDQVDSTSQYLAWARKGRQLGTKKLNSGMAPRILQPGEEQIMAGAGKSAVVMQHFMRGRFPQAIMATPSPKIGG